MEQNRENLGGPEPDTRLPVSKGAAESMESQNRTGDTGTVLVFLKLLKLN